MEKNKPNIILMTVDSLRPDHLGFMDYKKNISPNIDKLAKESNVFTQAFAVGPVTPHSLPSLLTSTYPLDFQGPRKIERPRKMISEVLKEKGFLTAAFHSNAYLSDFFGYNRGWNYFEDIIPPYDSDLSVGKVSIKKAIFRELVSLLGKPSLALFPELTFRIRYLMYKLGILRTTPKETPNANFVNGIVKDFVSAVKDEKKPFFAWVHYMDIHLPYLPYDCYFKERTLTYSELVSKELSGFLSKKYRSRGNFVKFSKKYIENTIDFYDQGIKYLDEQIGDLMDFLKRENVYQNSVIIFTSDHGDEFLEHHGGGHTSNLYNENLKVPLLIKIPEENERKINKKVSLIDLSSTICGLVGISLNPAFKGKNLFDSKKNIIFHQTAINQKEGWNASLTEIEKIENCKIACQSINWKYILNHSNKKEELYNLIQDPKEQNNLAETETEILSQMRKKVKEFEKENPPLSLVE